MAALNHEYGFDKPFWSSRYRAFTSAAFYGNLGASVQSRQEVTHVLMEHLPITLKLAVVSMTVSLMIAIPTALYCAVNQGPPLHCFVTAVPSGFLSILDRYRGFAYRACWPSWSA